jgi:hypothetical protein
VIARAKHWLPFLAVLTLALVAIYAAARAPARVDSAPVAQSTPAVQSIAYRTLAARSSSKHVWRSRVLELQARVRRLRHELLRKWNYPHLIKLAAATYRVDAATLERKARCESVDFTDFYNESSHATNVFQFLPSTWATTPFARFSINDPFAAVLAGAWMHASHRGGEWECK